MTTTSEPLTTPGENIENVTQEGMGRRQILALSVAGASALALTVAVTKPWRLFLSEAPPIKTEGGTGGGGVMKPEQTNAMPSQHIANTVRANAGLRAQLADFMGLSVLPEGTVQTAMLKDPEGKLPDTPAVNYHLFAEKRALSMTTLPAALVGDFATFEGSFSNPENGAARRNIWGLPNAIRPNTQLYHNSTGRAVVGFVDVGMSTERKFELFMDGNPNFSKLQPEEKAVQWNAVAGALIDAGALG